MVASPTYLLSAAALNNPNNPNDLVDHHWIEEKQLRCHYVEVFYKTDAQPIGVRVRPVLSSNVGQVVKDWAISARGIIQGSEWDIAEELAQGKLVSLLPEYTLPSADIVALALYSAR